ncbi:hypothetical protein [Streptomyces boluensis]|uniref:hypothetical protein n=1 Tax=Streptomyces boluensis TaxID=1775135 RepID=UPI00406B9E82
MGEVIAVLAVLFVLFVVLGVFVTVKVAKAAARGVDRTIEQARRTVEDTTLKAKTFTQPGAAGELARLRVQLRSTMKATQDALGAGAVEDASLQESLRLFERLTAHGHELDGELKRLERDPDKTRLGQRLPDLKERTDQIVHAADSLRWAAHDRARNFAEDDLAELGRQIDMESGALRHWTPAESTPAESMPAESRPAEPTRAESRSAEPTRAEPRSAEPTREESGTEDGAGRGRSADTSGSADTVVSTGTSSTAAPATPSWPEPTLIDGPAAPTEQTWPEAPADRDRPEARKRAESGPEAIEPSKPLPTYPWQKSVQRDAKPESAT